MWRWLEMGTVFWGLPAVVILTMSEPEKWMLPVLIATGVVCVLLLLRDRKFKRFRLYHTLHLRQHLLSLLKLFIPLAIGMSMLLYWIKPELLFFLPSQKTEFWLLTLAVYPVFSVLPQELIFRTFFFHRYKKIMPSKTWRLGMSSSSFAFAHLIYGNWVAVALSAVAGVVLGYRYIQTRSTLVVVIEHAVWGCFLFTLGIGVFLLHQV